VKKQNLESGRWFSSLSFFFCACYIHRFHLTDVLRGFWHLVFHDGVCRRNSSVHRSAPDQRPRAACELEMPTRTSLPTAPRVPAPAFSPRIPRAEETRRETKVASTMKNQTRTENSPRTPRGVRSGSGFYSPIGRAGALPAPPCLRGRFVRKIIERLSRAPLKLYMAVFAFHGVWYSTKQKFLALDA